MPVRDEIQFATQGEPRSLEARFDEPDVFAREYVENLSQGGVFIETTGSFELREVVAVELVLTFCNQRVRILGEIVNVRPPGLAGAPSGVAVQLLTPATELRDRLGRWVELGAVSQPPPFEPEERGAPRTPTRVQARVGDADVSARTVDLSPLGALLEVVPDELPDVGESIEVSLQHPVSGEELTIEGTVIRHHEIDGETTGVGVRFETNVVEQPGVERFVEDVQAAAHAKRLGAIRGPIDQLGLASLLQMFGASTPEGTLRLQRDGKEGSIAFAAGVLRHARVGELVGEKALARLLSWRDGSFEFHAQLEPGSPEDAPSQLDGAIFEAMRLVDELARVALPSTTSAGTFRLDRAQLESEAGPLEKIEEAVVDLVVAGFPFERMLDVIPVPDAAIHVALRSLLERGVLVAEPATAATTTTTAAAVAKAAPATAKATPTPKPPKKR
jgi:Tfp pilus assembly protein PilZ